MTLDRLVPFPRAALLVLAVVTTTVVAFGATYWLRGPEPVGIAQQPPVSPGLDTTPIPGVMADTSQPFWHIPYINQDREKPTFTGTLNGYEINPGGVGRKERTAFDMCPGVGLSDPAPGRLLPTVTGPGPLRIDPRTLPEGVVPTDGPYAFLCRDNPAITYWLFHVDAGTPHANPGGSDLSIHRNVGRDPVTHAAPRDRWSAVTIAGLPAVVASPIVSIGDKQFGDCFVALYDPRSDVFTTVSAGAANAEFCTSVMEVLVR